MFTVSYVLLLDSFLSVVCSSPLGMEEGNFRERRTRTSPAYSNHETPQLNHIDGFLASYAWSPFVQVDLGPAMKHVTAIAVQGIKRDHNTWSFYVKYMKDGSEWFNYTENGVVRVSSCTQMLSEGAHFEKCFHSK